MTPSHSRSIILTPCPPRAHCAVCEGRLHQRFGGATDKTAKYRHQAMNAGQEVRNAMVARKAPDAIYHLARRAGTYGLMVLEGQ